jgi:hypothetical protein
MQVKEKSIGVINAYIRGINSFLSWLHENNHLSEKLRIKPLKQEQKVMQIFTTAQLQAIVSFKTKSFPERRLHIPALPDDGYRSAYTASLDP